MESTVNAQTSNSLRPGSANLGVKSGIDVTDLEFDNRYTSMLNKLVEYDSTLKTVDKLFAYGTSGFRYDEKELDKISFRVALISVLKSQSFEGLPIGIMITASHNKYTDNGFKIAGVDGTSISSEWEKLYTDIINSKNLFEDVQNLIKSLLTQNITSIKYFFRDFIPHINIAYDTRRSSEGLAKIVTDCLQIMGAKFTNYGVLTSPALQYLTLINQHCFKQVNKNSNKFSFVDSKIYWSFLEGGYFAFNTFYDKFYAGKKSEGNNKYENQVLIDCCNGAAGYHAKKIAEMVGNNLNLHFINTDYQTYENLNHSCGAEHVHKEKKLPSNYPSEKSPSIKNLTFDGDVDRIIYFVYENNSEDLKIIEGDHLVCLFAQTLKFLLNKLSKSLQSKFLSDIKIGIVCTAYSNGAFMNYIKNCLNFPLILAKTGVKHLHHKAKNFDLAIYFESNGHGTIFYQDSIKSKIEKLNCFIESSVDSQTLELIQIFLSMFNRTTGDSLSAFLATECALKLMNMNLLEVYDMYKQYESINTKVVVKNKHIFLPNEDDSRLLEPKEVQDYIDELAVKYTDADVRCFVRPSGTEDIVRIYAEANSIEKAKEVMDLVYNMIQKNY